MRISKPGLLIVLAFMAPLLVELRVVLGWLDVELTVLQTVIVGIVIVAGVLTWAFLPEMRPGDDADEEPTSDLSNGN